MAINQVILMGRLTKDIEVRYAQGSDLAIGRFCLAVERDYQREGEEKANFINCVCFGNTAEFISKYFRKGSMIAVIGSIQTGSYDKDGQKVYYTEVKVDKASFTGEKKEDSQPAPQEKPQERPKPSNGDGFLSIPDGIDEELPFN